MKTSKQDILFIFLNSLYFMLLFVVFFKPASFVLIMSISSFVLFMLGYASSIFVSILLIISCMIVIFLFYKINVLIYNKYIFNLLKYISEKI